MSIFCVKGLFKKKPQIRVLEKRVIYKCVKMFATELSPTFCEFETISSKKKPQIRVLEKRNEIINIKRLIENRSM